MTFRDTFLLAICIGTVAASWTPVKTITDDTPMTLKFALRSITSLEDLDDKLMAVSDPDSPKRGQYYTLAEVNTLTGNPKAAARVKTWLKSNGASNVYAHGGPTYVSATLTAVQVRQLLQTTVSEYSFKTSPNTMVVERATVVAFDRYSLPPSIAVDVVYVSGSIHDKMTPKPKMSSQNPFASLQRNASKPTGGRFPSCTTGNEEQVIAYVPTTLDELKQKYQCLASLHPSYATPARLQQLYGYTAPAAVHPDSGIGEIEDAPTYSSLTRAYAAALNPNRTLASPTPTNLQANAAARKAAAQCAAALTSIANFDLARQNKNLTAIEQMCAGAEQALDFQMLAAVAPELETYGWYTHCDGGDCSGKFSPPEWADWLSYMAEHTGAPYVWTTSDSEATTLPPCALDVELGAGATGATAAACGGHLSGALAQTAARLAHQNVEFLKLGLRGYTVFAASGDTGTSAAGQSEITDTGILGRGASLETCGFRTSWPQSCPYVTVVGGTMPNLDVGGSTGNSNSSYFAAAQVLSDGSKHGSIVSGGGFSPVPGTTRAAHAAWQDAAVSGYLAKQTEAGAIDGYYVDADLGGSGNYNRWSGQLTNGLGGAKGRAYPDLAGSSYGAFLLEFAEGLGLMSGTSEASPVVGAMFALMNNELMNAGKSRLGFLNPTLYAVQADPATRGAFVDITEGNNAVSPAFNGQPRVECDASYGFTAGEGWDPTSGLGYIHYPAMLKAIADKMPAAAVAAHGLQQKRSHLRGRHAAS